MISTGELKRGVAIELDGVLYNIMDWEHIKMGRGSAQIRMKLRDLRKGHTVEKTFQAGEKFTRARVDRHSMQFLYADGDFFHFMNTESYEQMALTQEQVGTAADFLIENGNADVLTYGTEPIGVELPTNVILTITRTDPGFKGDTATGGTKPATLETGKTINVPLFLNEGDKISVDTRTGDYLGRA